ncbi:MAG: hypothetical protein MMC33_010539 [Icmadophila ericetorum]|nr:hypothetical protein [Icmadophila ericetorum]
MEKLENIFQVFSRRKLLGDFLRTFKSECKLANELGQSVVLMVFGHGDPETYGIAIGGTSTPMNAPRLHINHIATALRGLDIYLNSFVDKVSAYHVFLAQADQWEQEWRKRSGLPLAKFKERWEALPLLTPQPGIPRMPVKTGGLGSPRESMGDEGKGNYGLHKKFNKLQARKILADLAYGYLNSFSPLDTYGHDRQYNTNARALLIGKCLTTKALESLSGSLTYRLESAKLASQYKTILGIDFGECDNINVEEWRVEKERLAVLEDRVAEEELSLYNDYFDKICDSHQFDWTTPEQG